MRIAFAVLFTLIAGSALSPAQADPYRWCAKYNLSGGGATNCYFMTLEQCQATVSGVGGYCRHNPFYTGPAAEPRRAKPRPS